MYINKIGGEIKFTAEKELPFWATLNVEIMCAEVIRNVVSYIPPRAPGP